MESDQGLILSLFKAGLIQFGEFTLASGRKSSFYINLRVLPSLPNLFRSVMERSINLLKTIDFDTVCGVATGGVPFAAYIAFQLDKPLVYVRKKAKEYGSRDLLVGYSRGSVLVVDDVATTGGSLVRAVRVLKENNASPKFAFVVVLRCKSALEALRRENVQLLYLWDIQEIFGVLHKYGVIKEGFIKVEEC